MAYGCQIAEQAEMPIEILMPALSPTMTEGKLAKWHVKEGDEVKSGDVVAEIETDKATMEVEAVDEGTVGKILISEGTEGVQVNSVIALLLGEDEKANDLDAAAKAAEEKAPEAAEAEPAREQAGDQSAKDETMPDGASKKPLEKEPPAEPEWDGETVTITVREALRDAMAEEMRADSRVFVMGEEVAEYQGAYKVTHSTIGFRP